MDYNVKNTTEIIEDGLKYLETCTKQYDMIILDAFKGGNLNKEFVKPAVFEQIKKLLKPEGIFVTNYFEQLAMPYMVKRAVSPHFEHMVRVPIPGTYNFIVVASDVVVDMKKPAREIKDPALRRVARFAAENYVVDR